MAPTANSPRDNVSGCQRHEQPCDHRLAQQLKNTARHNGCGLTRGPSSINIAICAPRFFFNFTLQRDYEVFALLRVNRPRTLPVVLSRAEVKRLLGAVLRRLTPDQCLAFESHANCAVSNDARGPPPQATLH